MPSFHLLSQTVARKIKNHTHRFACNDFAISTGKTERNFDEKGRGKKKKSKANEKKGEREREEKESSSRVVRAIREAGIR